MKMLCCEATDGRELPGSAQGPFPAHPLPRPLRMNPPRSHASRKGGALALTLVGAYFQYFKIVERSLLITI